MRLFIGVSAIFFLIVSVAAAAEDSFDGTKPLLCASLEALDCTPGEQCEKGLPEVIGAPQFLRVDFAKKEITGPKRTTAIRQMDKSDEQLTLQGYEVGMGWTLAIDRVTGKMTVTFSGSEQAFVIFGACTVL